MAMHKHLFSFILLLLFIPIQAWSNINFHQLDLKSGISDNFVQGIVQDRDGFMWFATRNGVNRYDGYRFTHYPTV